MGVFETQRLLKHLAADSNLEVNFNEIQKAIHDLLDMDLRDCIHKGLQAILIGQEQTISIHLIKRCILGAIKVNFDDPKVLKIL